MRKTMLVFRSLMGLLLIVSSVTFLFKMFTPPPLTGALKVFNDGMEAAVYMMPTVKVLELLCGVAFLSGFYVPLATVVMAPIIINILLVHVFLAPSGLPVAVFLVVANGIVAYYYREAYKPLLKA